MARTIDHFALTILGATGCYLIFLHLRLPIPLCCLLAFICTVLGREALSRMPRRYCATPAQARAALLTIAMLPEDEAARRLGALTGRDDLIPVLRHPSARLDAAAVFDLWRMHRDAPSPCFAATCPADAGAFEMARTLNLTLVDAAALEKALRRTGRFMPPEPPREPLPRRLRRAGNALLDRPPALRTALCGMSLLSMYRLTGLLPCLPAGLLLLGLTGVRWIRRAT